ncbi:MAG: amidohydrolase family protein [Planctomycetota bacterium]
MARSFVEHDLTRSGVISAQWRAAAKSEPDGWANIRRVLPLCRNTGYLRGFLIAVQDLLGVQITEIDDSNWESVSAAFADANARSDWYKHVLRTCGNIDAVLWDQPPAEAAWPSMDRSLFIPLARFDWFAFIRLPDYRESIRRQCGDIPHTLSDVLDLMDRAVAERVQTGIGGIKIAAAYFRRLDFGEPSRSHASRVFATITSDLTEADVGQYETFIFSEIAKRAATWDLTVQIHTGMLAVNRLLSRPENGVPLPLENFLAQHSDVRFVLLHGGFPHTRDVTSLVARYPNLYVDGSWLPLLSPSAYRRTLSEWLDVLPTDRILAWGGDALRVEMSYGSLTLAKRVMADVLAERVESKILDESEAIAVAWKILRENALSLFKINEVRNKRLQHTMAGSASMS